MQQKDDSSIFLTLYDAEALTLQEKIQKKIEAPENTDIQEKMEHTPWIEMKIEGLNALKLKKRNNEIIRTGRLKYFSHIKRHNMKLIVHGNAEGNRATGQQYRQQDDIKRWTA